MSASEIFYLAASAVIALGLIGIAIASWDRASDRARGYAQGSYERKTLEGLRP
ncbi:hypothetical protein [Rhodococcoides fascians]|uniref:hypothetical protein n=1 Tax=Rhodococcoides fascians TaxID=1828 RepID=UPI0037AEDEF8